MKLTTAAKKSRGLRSISRRFSYAFIGVVTFLLFGFAAVAIFINISQSQAELERRLSGALRLAEASLPKPLWNLDSDVADDFVGALFLDDAIVHAKIVWAGQIIASRTARNLENVDFSFLETSRQFVVGTSNISFAGKKVGSVTIAMSRQSIRDEIIFNIAGIIALTTLLIVGIYFTSVGMTSKYISRPLSNLQGSAAAIAHGDLEAPIETSGNDEIGNLARDLNTMRESIRTLFAELRDSHEALEEYGRTLERKVEERTAELAQAVREAENARAAVEEEVRKQVVELERVSQLKRFFSPQLAELMISSGQEKLMESHRREITVVFCDLRGFTAFAETAEPEVVMRVLREYHEAVGPLIFQYEATLEHFAGDGMMALFNDPLPCPDPAVRAVQMAMGMQREVGKLVELWRGQGYVLGFGVGIAMGYATMGQIGFEGRFHYGAIGSVINLASRLGDEAEAGQILVTQQVYAEIEQISEAVQVGELTLKGFLKPIAAFNVRGMKPGIS